MGYSWFRRPLWVLKILVADDDEGDCKQMRRALKQAGFIYECVESSSVEEALATCDKGTFDCAFMDYNMSGHDGIFGVDVLHTRIPFTAIIMVTGHGDETVAAEAMKRGVSDYVSQSGRSKRRASLGWRPV